MFFFFMSKLNSKDSTVNITSALILVVARTRRSFLFSFSSGTLCDWWYILCYVYTNIPSRIFDDVTYTTWGHNFVHFVDFMYLSDMFVTAIAMCYAFQSVKRDSSGISKNHQFPISSFFNCSKLASERIAFKISLNCSTNCSVIAWCNSVILTDNRVVSCGKHSAP